MCHRIRRNVQLRGRLGVALEQLDGEPALLLLRKIVQRRLLDVRQRVLNAAAEGMRRRATNACLRRLDCRRRQLGKSLLFERGNLKHRHMQRVGQRLCVQDVAVLADEIHHVDGDHDRNAHLQQLGGQVQIALQIGAVNQVDDRIRTLVHQIIPGDHLLQRVGR